MQIKQPLCITSRLLPGVKIGEGTISIEYAHLTPDGRQVYRWFMDTNDRATRRTHNKRGLNRTFQGEDLASGVEGGSLQEGLKSLLGFLSAFAEAIAFQERTGVKSENANLFPAGLAEWATQNADEIGIMAYELDEKPGEFIVE